MFYPKCPRCGGKTKSLEPHMSGGSPSFRHAHPAVSLWITGMSAARAVWQRVPGGGKKQCTECSHEFS